MRLKPEVMIEQLGWLKRDFIADLYIPEESVAHTGRMKSYRSLPIRPLKPTTNSSRCAIKAAADSANMDQRRSQRGSDMHRIFNGGNRPISMEKYDIRA
jgi:hypothetical protein